MCRKLGGHLSRNGFACFSGAEGMSKILWCDASTLRVDLICSTIELCIFSVDRRAKGIVYTIYLILLVCARVWSTAGDVWDKVNVVRTASRLLEAIANYGSFQNLDIVHSLQRTFFSCDIVWHLLISNMEYWFKHKGCTQSANIYAKQETFFR